MVAARKRNSVSAHNGHAGRGLQARLKSLRGDMGALQDDVAGLVGDMGDAAGEQVQGAMSGALRSARDTANRVEDWGNENMGGMRKMVRNQPFTSCVLALGMGAVLGFLLRR
jgi:ElaB/YqjD/DUF883 family membrane-anchored ribosome-binding protein